MFREILYETKGPESTYTCKYVRRTIVTHVYLSWLGDINDNKPSFKAVNPAQHSSDKTALTYYLDKIGFATARAKKSIYF